jgi:O-antigen ligase
MRASGTLTFDRARLRQVADWLAVAVAASLPWSTTATEILLGLWLVALLPTLDRETLREAFAAPAGLFPAALFGLAAIGMIWSVAPWFETLGGLRSFLRLLAIPLLFAQFARSPRGACVAAGFFGSCAVLLALSWTLKFFPALAWRPMVTPGVPVKEYVVQSGEFLLCAFALAHFALSYWRDGRRTHAVATAALGILFLANIVFVATSRTSLIVFAVFLVAFGMQRLGARGTLGVLLAGAVVAAAAWASSPYLRSRVTGTFEEIERYETEKAETSAGWRLEFWKKSATFIKAAPLVGHGTGATEELFRRARGESGISAAVTGNPHNQFLLIAVELGLIGVAFLAAMFIAHALLFAGAGWPAWVGMGVVLQNVVSSVFNAQLFYFTPGWTYVWGVGVLGGMVLRSRRAD